MSMHDAERMAGLLEREGYAPTDNEATADLVVINTCSVRERAEEKLFTRLGELKADRGPDQHRRVVNLVEQVQIDLNALVSHRFPLLQAAEAFAANSAYREGVVKVAVDCQR